MIMQGRRGPKSAEQHRVKTQSEVKSLSLVMGRGSEKSQARHYLGLCTADSQAKED